MRVSLAVLIVAGLMLLRAGGYALSLVSPKPRGDFAGRETPTGDSAKTEWLRDRARGEARLLWLVPLLVVVAGIAWILGY